MEHETPLITTIAVGLGVAFILGALANRLKVSPIVGYLLAGVFIGPATPGYVADVELAPELAEIGVILLMFGVGLHFSLKDLLSVKAIAIPGAIAQITLATLMGLALGMALGWTLSAGIVFGLALSVASTVVLLRALQEHHLLDTTRGRIAVGWLIVEDLVMVFALVLLPALAEIGNAADGAGGGTSDLLAAVGFTAGKVAAFVALMLIVGRRVVPWVLHYIAHTGSRELFRLAVLALALGMAFGASKLFGVSFALGAFFAGMILSESALSQQAAQESLPFRDAFAVLFFVSVGMLFDPVVLIEQPVSVLITVLIIIFGKSIVAYLIVRLFRYSSGVALTISASLAQVGEFSFILGGLGLALGVLPQTGMDLILAGAIVSILLNPVLFDLLDRRRAAAAVAAATAAPVPPAAAEATAAPGEAEAASVETPAAEEKPAKEEPVPIVDEDDAEGLVPTTLTDHAVLVGYGRVGSLIGIGLKEAGFPFLVIEDRPTLVEAVRADGIEAFLGNGADEAMLEAANIAGAKKLFVAIPEAFEAGNIVKTARGANPALLIVARAHSDAEVEHLANQGADEIVMGEREIARSMLGLAFLKKKEPPPVEPPEASSETAA